MTMFRSLPYRSLANVASGSGQDASFTKILITDDTEENEKRGMDSEGKCSADIARMMHTAEGTVRTICRKRSAGSMPEIVSRRVAWVAMPAGSGAVRDAMRIGDLHPHCRQT
jgi:hypothetical protein